MEPSGLADIRTDMVRLLINARRLEDHRLDGEYLVAVDGTEQHRFKNSEISKRKSLTTSDRKMWKGIDQRMDSCADKLDPILNVRGKTIVLPRTNNLSETGFRDFKRRLRRTTGNGNLSRQLDQTPAEAFYAENLSCPDYTRIVFGGRTMAEALADIDRTTIRQAVEVMKEPPAPGIINHHFINRDDFYEAVQAKFSKILAVNTK